MSQLEKTILTTNEIAAHFFELVSSGKFEEAQTTYFSPEIISIELPDVDGFRKKDQGIDAITTKRESFQAAVASVEGLKASQPIVQGNSFAFEFELDFTLNGGIQQRLAEICVYQIEDGKIVVEQFFN